MYIFKIIRINYMLAGGAESQMTRHVVRCICCQITSLFKCIV